MRIDTFFSTLAVYGVPVPRLSEGCSLVAGVTVTYNIDD